ncbi:MAG TPA: Holliday junction resolvase RuvX [Gammaproteobacteria bacterium]|nr:Holliday junction resolvase RuvX [Gammaproteobacteria bacterium]
MTSNELIMGFDYGTKKIGVAIGQRVTRTANPVAIVRAENGKLDWSHIERLVDEWRPQQFVVGLPLNMDDSESEMSKLATRFSSQLQARFSITVHCMDERLSTFEARQNETGNRNSRKAEFDDAAAALILESWLRQQP